MDTFFLLKLLASFVGGGALIIAVTCLAERSNPRLAGLISALPTTLVNGVIFITIATDIHGAAHAMSILPTGVLAVMAFTVGFASWYPRGLMAALIGGGIPWILFAFLAISLPANVWLHLTFLILLYPFFALYASTFPKLKAPKVQATTNELVIRALVAGMAISTVLVVTKYAGPIWGGIFTCFPAAIFCTLYLMARKYGPDFAKTLARNMPHGSAGCGLFGVAFYLTAPHFGNITGLIIGITAGYITAICSSLFLSDFFHKWQTKIFTFPAKEDNI